MEEDCPFMINLELSYQGNYTHRKIVIPSLPRGVENSPQDDSIYKDFEKTTDLLPIIVFLIFQFH